MVDAAIEEDADAILPPVSTIISHANIHRKNMERLAPNLRGKGVRDKFILVAGGYSSHQRSCPRSPGLDAGFGQEQGIHVASFQRKHKELKAKQERGIPLMKIDVLVAEIGTTTTVVNGFDLAQGGPCSLGRAYLAQWRIPTM